MEKSKDNFVDKIRMIRKAYQEGREDVLKEILKLQKGSVKGNEYVNVKSIKKLLTK